MVGMVVMVVAGIMRTGKMATSQSQQSMHDGKDQIRRRE